MIYKIGKQRHSGFIALIVLVGIAIIAVLYFLQASSFFNVSPSPGSKTGEYRKPWHDEDRLLGADTIIELPSPPKLQLDEPFILETDVSINGKDRGVMTLEFFDDGTVSGSWGCEYSYDQRYFSYEADFLGNIDVEVVYKNDEGKKDKTQLYFIAKGKYTKNTYIESTGNSSTENGLVYVTGFIKPDYIASGKITITTDKEWSSQYQWQTTLSRKDQKIKETADYAD